MSFNHYQIPLIWCSYAFSGIIAIPAALKLWGVWNDPFLDDRQGLGWLLLVVIQLAAALACNALVCARLIRNYQHNVYNTLSINLLPVALGSAYVIQATIAVTSFLAVSIICGKFDLHTPTSTSTTTGESVAITRQSFLVYTALHSQFTVEYTACV
jgi:hypothetical protein